MVEFAIALPFFMMLLIGIIEVGHLLFYLGSVYAATREAARYGAAVNDEGGAPKYLDTVGIREAAKRVGFILGLADDQIDIQYDCGTGTTRTASAPTCTGGLLLRVAVRVDASYESIVPLPFVPDFPISSTSVRTIVNEVTVEGNFPTRVPPPPTPAPDCSELVLDQGGQLPGYPQWHIVTVVAGDEPITMYSLEVDAKTPKRKLEKVLVDPDLSLNPDPDAVTTNVIWDDPKFTAIIYLDGRHVNTVERRFLMKFTAYPTESYEADVTLSTWCPSPQTITVQGTIP